MPFHKNSLSREEKPGVRPADKDSKKAALSQDQRSAELGPETAFLSGLLHQKDTDTTKFAQFQRSMETLDRTVLVFFMQPACRWIENSFSPNKLLYIRNRNILR